MDLGMVGLLLGMVALGFRHGFDWDHIAAITDITSTTTASHADVDVSAGSPIAARGHGEHVTLHSHSSYSARGCCSPSSRCFGARTTSGCAAAGCLSST